LKRLFYLVTDLRQSQLCVTVTAATTAELRQRRDEVADADLVELRLDSVRDPDVAGALEGRTRPVIITCRPTWEGGAFRGSEEERKRILSDALAMGAELVDIEWRARFDGLASEGQRVVLSMHDFDGIPADLASRLRAMRATGARVVKLAVTATHLADCVTLLDFGAQAGGADSLVLLAMGDYGLPTRVLASRFGSAWTYAGSVRDVGQLSAQTMLLDYRFRALTDATRVYGIVGGSVGHSVSAAMHNAAFRALGLDAVYLPLPATSVDDFVAFAKGMGIGGASVTIPYKVELFDRLDEVYAAARRVGAINTIRIEDGRWVGDNTDTGGFLLPLQERLSLEGLRASVLGAGGAARAVADALASSRCTVRVHARQPSGAERVAMLTAAEVGPWPPQPGSWDLLINCTPIGQYPHTGETPVPGDQLTGRYVYDLVYNPTATRLLREAAQAGCQTFSGIEMLVAQAQEQFRWWTGVRAPAGIMREAALKRLAEFACDEDHVI
jgi:3-dehydroquinate dehydratase/shikimate dehydrogenase